MTARDLLTPMQHQRKAVLLLAKTMTGVALDDDCPACRHPELSGILTAQNDFLGVTLCRKCGWAKTS